MPARPSIVMILTAIILCLLPADRTTAAIIELPGLSFDAPDDWERVEHDEKVLVLRSPMESPDDDFLEYVMIDSYSIPERTPLDTIFFSQLKAAVDEGFKSVDSGELNETSTRVGWMAIAPDSPAMKGSDLIKVDYLFVDDGKLYVFQCMVHESRYDSYKKKFDNLVRSVSFPNGPTNPRPAVVDRPLSAKRSAAFLEGARAGNITWYVMVAVVVGAAALWIARRLFRTKPATPGSDAPSA